jgi:pyridoxal phosphate enzyme (YggS family)
MAEAALRTGRLPEDIQLVAVSKTFPAEAVCEAIGAGQMDFGENRVEEALDKIAAVGSTGLMVGQVHWHLIGHVQSRKARDAAGRFHLIHSMDSLKLAQKLSGYCVATATQQDILLECNVSGEVSKDGFTVAGWERDRDVLDRFTHEVEQIVALPSIRVRGLMTIAPIVEQPEQTRPCFASLRALRDELRARFLRVDWRHLSMGMTDDFEAAIAEGATLVRIGRAIFGART